MSLLMLLQPVPLPFVAFPVIFPNALMQASVVLLLPLAASNLAQTASYKDQTQEMRKESFLLKLSFLSPSK